MIQSDKDSYAAHINPYLAGILKTLGMDKEYVRGDGSWLMDASGRRYLDFIAGYGAVPFGHAPAFAGEALARYLSQGAPSLVQPSILGPAARLAHKLLEMAPQGLNYVWYANSGAEAVEAALKACRAATRRKGVIYALGSFHGKTMGALAVTGSAKYQAPFFTPVDDFHAVQYGSVDAIAEALAQHAATTACVILEPIQGEGGIVVPPEGYLAAVRELCDRHGVLLVLDEVQTGLGRTGTLFACEAEGVVPDVMTLSKALGGGVVPIGCCLLREQAFSEDFALYHSSTFAGNGLACTVAHSVLEQFQDETQGILTNVQACGQYLLNGLNTLAKSYPEVVRSVRGRGLLLGIELGFMRSPECGRFGAMLEALSDQGVLIPVVSSYLLEVHGVRTAPTLTSGHVLRIEPPLNVSLDECDQFLCALGHMLHILASGDSGALIEHLILDEHERGQLRVLVTPEKHPATVPAQPQPQDSRVAFLVHTLDEQSVTEFDSSLQRFGTRALYRAAKLGDQFLKPFVAGRTRIVSGDASVYCEFISVPKLPESLQALSVDDAEAEIAGALLLAKERGAELVGLGAYTSVVTQGGTRVTKYGIPVTTGNTYTVITAFLAAEEAAARIGLSLANAHMVVVGATGMIGSSLVDTYLGRTGRLSLIGNPMRPDASRRRLLSHLTATLAEEVSGDPERMARLSVDPDARRLMESGAYADLAQMMVNGDSALPVTCDVVVDPYLPDADIVICATSSTEILIDVARLKRGAILLDLSRPANVARAMLDTRPDVLFIDGGVVAFPNLPDLGLDFGFPRGHGFACMAETVMLGLARRFEHCSIGVRIDRPTRNLVGGLAQRYGFELSGLRSFNRQMKDGDWQIYLNARNNGHTMPTLSDEFDRPGGAQDRIDLAWVSEPAVRPLAAVDPSNICDWIMGRHQGMLGDRVAVISGVRSVTYAALNQLSGFAAQRLQHEGVMPGDFVVLAGPDSVDMLACMIACWRLGAVATPINPGLPIAVHLDMLRALQPKRVLLDASLQATLDALREQGFECCTLADCVEETEMPLGPDVYPVTPATAAVALFSSGSTGKPKPVVHTHGDLLSVNLNYVPTVVGLEAGETVFSPSRMFFAYGFNAVIFALFVGGTAVLAPEPSRPEVLCQMLVNHRVNVLFSVPTVLKLLFAHWPSLNLALPALRLCVSAGEFLPSSLYAEAMERMGVEIIDGIGTTEVLSTFISNRPGESRPDCTGLVVPGFEIKLLNEQGNTCVIGEAGTLWVRGETLAKGIHGDPGLTDKVFQAGWFNTKDLFYMDAGRHFHYVGRANDVLKINGCWVAPHQIEESLMRHPLVADCAVVPVTDEHGLLRPKAFVVISSPVDDFESLWKELKAFSKQQVGTHQYPHFFETIEALPRTSSGKLQRSQLRTQEIQP
jgi:acetylornithine/succinyldiaminopimelate/putrescine aminotransferase/acyl-coenzyme A synthetase/AMP-(fatty) acid ligase/predicted amino acid dehydrogenase